VKREGHKIRKDTGHKSPPFERINPPVSKGLTSGEVKLRTDAGAVNTVSGGLTPSVAQILRKNIFTLFNFINASLALLLIAAGEPKNALFVGVALFSTIISAFQELRAKRTLDKLSILRKGKVTVIRDGAETAIEPEELVSDDIVRLSAGDQAYADAVIVESDGLEVNESLLTGEADNASKRAGDTVLSGSFAAAGAAFARITAVGAGSYASALTAEAKKVKTKKSQLVRMLNGIIRILMFVIIPFGALLFYTETRSGIGRTEAILSAAAAMTGMIPQGLVLLTGVTLAVGAVSLSRRKALAQSLYSIETLARTDVLCLDKTGTMTDGTLAFEELIPQEGFSGDDARTALARLNAALKDNNATALALRSAFPPADSEITAAVTIPFSSERKWSGAYFENIGSLILGAPGFVFPGQTFEAAQQPLAEGFRVLCLACSPERMREYGKLPGGLLCMALVILSDNMRADAPDTFRFFTEQGMALKVISGDDPQAAAAVAARAGIPGAGKAIDMSVFDGNSNLSQTAEAYTVFGRVSPRQKRDLVRALRQNGHVACMTGDGVNDVLAMKEADCSVAMAGGSSAAGGASDFVLMSSDFSAMVQVMNEGRRVINNIEKVSALYLVRTIYSVILAIIYIFLPFSYPFIPVQMTVVNALAVGIPTFFLALRADTRKPEGKFIEGVLKNSLPAALTAVIMVLSVQVLQIRLALSAETASTICVFLIGMVGFAVLGIISRPINFLTGFMLGLLAGAYFALFTVVNYIREIFSLESILSINALLYVPLLFAGFCLFAILRGIICLVIGKTRGKSAC